MGFIGNTFSRSSNVVRRNLNRGKVMASAFGERLGQAEAHMAFVDSGVGLQNRFKGIFRGIQSEVVNPIMADGGSGLRSAWSQAHAPGASIADRFSDVGKYMKTNPFTAGFGARVGTGAVVGGLAGAGRSYYNGDSPSGYASSIMSGAGIGAAAGFGYHHFKTPGTLLNSAFSGPDSAMRAAWRAR